MRVTMILKFPASYCHLARGIAQVYLLYFWIDRSRSKPESLWSNDRWNDEENQEWQSSTQTSGNTGKAWELVLIGWRMRLSIIISAKGIENSLLLTGWKIMVLFIELVGIMFRGYSYVKVYMDKPPRLVSFPQEIFQHGLDLVKKIP